MDVNKKKRPERGVSMGDTKQNPRRQQKNSKKKMEQRLLLPNKRGGGFSPKKLKTKEKALREKKNSRWEPNNIGEGV